MLTASNTARARLSLTVACLILLLLMFSAFAKADEQPVGAVVPEAAICATALAESNVRAFGVVETAKACAKTYFDAQRGTWMPLPLRLSAIGFTISTVIQAVRPE